MPKVEDGAWNLWECDCGCGETFFLAYGSTRDAKHYKDTAHKQRAYRDRRYAEKRGISLDRLKAWRRRDRQGKR